MGGGLEGGSFGVGEGGGVEVLVFGGVVGVEEED